MKSEKNVLREKNKKIKLRDVKLQKKKKNKEGIQIETHRETLVNIF